MRRLFVTRNSHWLGTGARSRCSHFDHRMKEKMTKLKLLGAAAVLSTALTTPVLAQEATQEPGATGFNYPNSNYLTGGYGVRTPYNTSRYPRMPYGGYVAYDVAPVASPLVLRPLSFLPRSHRHPTTLTPTILIDALKTGDERAIAHPLFRRPRKFHAASCVLHQIATLSANCGQRRWSGFVAGGVGAKSWGTRNWPTG